MVMFGVADMEWLSWVSPLTGFSISYTHAPSRPFSAQPSRTFLFTHAPSRPPAHAPSNLARVTSTSPRTPAS